MDTDGALPFAVRRIIGEAISASPNVVGALVDWAQQPPASALGNTGAPGAGTASKVNGTPAAKAPQAPPVH